MNIYVPNNTYACYVVIDNQTIRAYEKDPNANMGISINYRDYYINSHYLYRDNSEVINQSITCISSEILTDNWYYRNDLPDILMIIVIFCLFGLYLPIQVVLRLFKRFQ
jgi:hypothetical protein